MTHETDGPRCVVRISGLITHLQLLLVQEQHGSPFQQESSV
jgi:hypothetical protein